MSEIILPSRPNRIWLINFWLAISLFSGLLIGFFSWFILSPRWSSLGVIMTLSLALPGILLSQVLSVPYRFWNKIAHSFSRLASQLLMGICFYIIFVAIGRTGSYLMINRPFSVKSFWLQRRTLTPTTYFSQHDVTMKDSPEKGWISAFLSWSIRSGNLWACCLLPFLILLSFFETDQKDSVSATIYTLY